MSYTARNVDGMSASNLKSQASEEAPGVPAEEHIPGAGRRNWVYREMAVLGGEPISGIEALLYLDDPDESQSSASEESAASPTRKQSSSR